MTQFDQISRLNIVFDRIKMMASNDDKFREEFMDSLNMILDEMYENDAFGTEGQTDPRGDQRDGIWTMSAVQGFDDQQIDNT